MHQNTHARAFTPWRETWLSLGEIKCLFRAEDLKKKKKETVVDV